MIDLFGSTLFSKCLAHGNHPICLKSLGHRPQPRVILRTFYKLDLTQGLGELGEINVQFFVRRVYFGDSNLYSGVKLRP